jgi:hypothetical protein
VIDLEAPGIAFTGLKIRVSVVRFRPLATIQIKALVENDTDVKCPIFIGQSSGPNWVFS